MELCECGGCVGRGGEGEREGHVENKRRVIRAVGKPQE